MEVLQTFTASHWQENFSKILQSKAIQELESGKVLFFPHLAFNVFDAESFIFLTEYADPQAKNVSYFPHLKEVKGVKNLNENQHKDLQKLMERFFNYAHGLIQALFPTYMNQLIIGRSSYRPIQISDRATSYRKDDKRLHVDAFPSSPTQGKRILRVFCNINPHKIPRVWRIGEPFEHVVDQFWPRLSKPVIPGFSWLLKRLNITKSYRTLYDHLMLQLHDQMKLDQKYQLKAEQITFPFPANSTWIVQTDHVSHAAMSGQYLLEQTFYLPVLSMQNPELSPLKVLEKRAKKLLANLDG